MEVKGKLIDLIGKPENNEKSYFVSWGGGWSLNQTKWNSRQP
jgi:hypothetical protein